VPAARALAKPVLSSGYDESAARSRLELGTLVAVEAKGAG
jgi:hypothetical protein